MKVLVEVFDPNWGLRVSYPVPERGEAASAEDHARRGLRRAVQDGHVSARPALAGLLWTDPIKRPADERGTV